MKLKNIFKTYSGLPRSVYVIFIAQVINRFGDFVMPFLTLLLTTQFNYSIAQTGTIVMLTMLLSIPGGLIGGKVADHLGRKKSYLIFQGGSGLSLLLCAFLYTKPIMLVFIMITSFFGGAVRPIISAMLSDVLKPEDRQAGFSLSYLGVNLGVALGPIVAGFLFNNYRFWIFMGDAITTFVAIALVMVTISESLPSKNISEVEIHTNERHESGNIFKVLMSRPKLLLFMFFNMFYSATYVQGGFSLPLVLNHIYAEKGPQIYGSLMSTNAITVLILTIAMTAFSKRFSSISNIAIGGIAYIIGFGMIGIFQSIPLFWISTIIWTLGEIIISINFGVYVTSQTPQNFRARFNAVTNISFGIGAIMGTALIGLFIDQFGILKVWGLVATIAAIGAAGMFILAKSEKEKLK